MKPKYVDPYPDMPCPPPNPVWWVVVPKPFICQILTNLNVIPPTCYVLSKSGWEALQEGAVNLGLQPDQADIFLESDKPFFGRVSNVNALLGSTKVNGRMRRARASR